MSFGLRLFRSPRVGHAVHDPQRAVACVERTETADADVGGSTGLARRVRQLHTGDLTGQRLGNVRLLRFGDVVRFDHGSRSGKGLFLGRTECDDDDVVDGLGVLLEGDVDSGFAGYSDLLRLIADERDEESGIRGSRDRVAAISVRGRTRGRSFDQDGGTCNRISGVVLDRSGYLELLRKGREAGAQHNR